MEEFLVGKSQTVVEENPQNEEQVSNRLQSLEKEVKVLREQIDAQQDMLQLTVNHLQSTSIETTSSLPDKLLNEYFQASEKLKKVLPKSEVHQIGKKQTGNDSLFHLVDKFGILYLITIQLPKSTSQNSYLLTVIGLEIENVLAVKRYADAAQIIEKIRLRLQKILDLVQDFELNHIEMGVCMIDPDHFDVEFASTGHPILSVANGVVKQYIGGRNDGKNQEIPLHLASDFLLNKMNFRKDTTLFIPFLAPKNLWDDGQKFRNCLKEIALKSKKEQKEYLEKFLEENPPENADKPFQLISIQF